MTNSDDVHNAALIRSSIGAVVAGSLILVIGFWSPQARIWGFDGMVGWSPFGMVGWTAVSAAVAVVFAWLARRSDDEAWGRLTHWAVLVLLGLLLFLFPSATLLRGDGQMLVTTYSRGGTVDYHTPLYTLLIKTLVRLAGMEPLAAFKLVTNCATVLALLAIGWYARRFPHPSQKLFATFVGLGCGTLLMYGGVVEYYPLTFAVLTWAMVVTLGALRRGKIPVSGLLLFALGMSLHLGIVSLLPACVFLFEKKLGRKKAMILFVAIAVVGFVGSLVAMRANLLPPFGNDNVDDYTFFSLVHWVDILNLVVWAVPVLLFVLLPFWGKSVASSWSTVDRFTALAALGAFGFALFFDPELGMGRDADIVGLFAIPAVFWAIQRTLHRTEYVHPFLIAAVLFVVLMTVGTQYAVQADEAKSVARHRHLLELDDGRSGYGWEVMGVYYRQHQETKLEEEAFLKAIDVDPNGRYYVRLAQIYSARKDYEKAAPFAIEGAEKRSRSFNAQGVCGHILFMLDRSEEAQPYFEKAIELKTRDANVFSMLAYTYMMQKESDKAIGVLSRGNGVAINKNCQFYTMYGMVAEQRGEFKTAFEMYSSALKVDQEMPWAERAKLGRQRTYARLQSGAEQKR